MHTTAGIKPFNHLQTFSFAKNTKSEDSIFPKFSRADHILEIRLPTFETLQECAIRKRLTILHASK